MTKAQQLQARTYRFACEVVQFCRQLPSTPQITKISCQLVSSGTSVAANYRAACRARSTAEFIAKIGTVVEEADESVLWLQLMVDTQLGDQRSAQKLLREAEELLAIFAASQRTAKTNRNRRSNRQ